ncbi:MAG: DUF2339 domain-containing protein [Armatimonadota bacterium]
MEGLILLILLVLGLIFGAGVWLGRSAGGSAAVADLTLEQRVLRLEAQMEAALRRIARVETGSSPPEPEPETAWTGAAAPPAEPVALSPDFFLPQPAPEPPRPAPAPVFMAHRLPAVSPPPLAAPAAGAPVPGARPEVSWEDRIGGQWLNWLGGASLVIALALFLKWAYDQGWLTPLLYLNPWVYLGLGWALGGALLLFGERLRASLPLYAQTLAGAGIAALYVTTYAAHAQYGRLSASAATAGLAAVGGIALAMALRHDSPVIGWIGLILAYVSPLVFRTPTASPAPLFLYLTALNGAILAFSIFRKWPGFRLAGLLATALLYLTWYEGRYSPADFGAATGFVVVSFGIFLGSLVLYPLLRREPGADPDLMLAVCNPVLAAGALYALLEPRHPEWLGASAIGLAAVHYAAARLVRARHGEPAYLEQVTFALALLFLILAVPLQFRSSGTAVTAGWALLGAALSEVGYRSGSARTRTWGGIALGLGLLRLVLADALSPEPVQGLFFQPRSFAFAAVIAALALRASVSLREWTASDRAGREHERAVAVLGLLIGGLLNWWALIDLRLTDWLLVSSAVAALTLAFGGRLRSGDVRVVGAVLCLAPLLGAWHWETPTEIIPLDRHLAFAMVVALLAGAAVAYHRSDPELIPERSLAPLFSAAAAFLAMNHGWAALPGPWIVVAWSAVGALAFGAGLLAGTPHQRGVGYAAAGLTALWLAAAALTGGAMASPAGFAAALALIGGIAAVLFRGQDLTQEETSAGASIAAGAGAALSMLWAWRELGAGWLPFTWALAALGLLYLGVRTERPELRTLSLAALLLVTVEVLVRELALPPGSRVLFHSRSAAALSALAGWSLCAWVFLTRGSEAERALVPAVVAAANLQALGWLSIEAMDAAGRLGTTGWGGDPAKFALSAVWTLYGCAAILIGFRRGSEAVRWGGMALLLAAVVKVYLFDLSFLQAGYRVLSFLVLAVVLLGVSYAYQRRAREPQSPARGESEPGGVL